jgi:hypothetical protein
MISTGLTTLHFMNFLFYSLSLCLALLVSLSNVSMSELLVPSRPSDLPPQPFLLSAFRDYCALRVSSNTEKRDDKVRIAFDYYFLAALRSPYTLIYDLNSWERQRPTNYECVQSKQEPAG